MRIGFTIDNPKRDLKGLIITSKNLIQEGHEVVLFPMRYVSIDAILGQLDVMVFNYIRPNNLRLIKKLISNGIKIYILDTEGGILSEDGLDSPDNWARSFKQLRYHKYVDGYFFWGQRLYQAFKDHSGLKEDQLFLTGCPRYDQCHDEWSSIQEPRHKNHVLINTNFSSINPKFSSSKDEEKKVLVNAGWKKMYVNNFFDEMSEAFLCLIEEIKKISTSMPNQEFILRPHPFENKNNYTKIFLGYKNIKIDDGGDIFDAILGAKCILHLNCGTSVDAYLSGVLPISIEYLNTAFMQKHTPLPSSTSYQANSLSDLKSAITAPAATFKELEKLNVYDKHIAPFFYFPDGKASSRISSILAKIQLKSKKTTSLNIFLLLIKGQNFFNKIYKFSSYIFGTKLISNIRSLLSRSHKDKNLNIDHIKSIYKAIGLDSGSINFRYLKSFNRVLKNTAILIKKI